MEGGEIFIPKIPSTKITDLADVIAPKAKKKITGIRPGEKLHEMLITIEEARHALEFDDHFIIRPEFKFWDDEKRNNHADGKELPELFSYSSDNNTWWFNKDELKELMIKEKWIS